MTLDLHPDSLLEAIERIRAHHPSLDQSASADLCDVVIASTKWLERERPEIAEEASQSLYWIWAAVAHPRGDRSFWRNRGLDLSGRDNQAYGPKTLKAACDLVERTVRAVARGFVR